MEDGSDIMKCAADFRMLARNALRGKWTVAVIACVIASMLGAATSGGPELSLDFGDHGAVASLDFAGQQIYSTDVGLNDSFGDLWIGGEIIGAITAMVIATAFLVIGSVIEIGYTQFNLDLIDRRKLPQINTLFGYFSHWRTAAAARFLQILYVLLWSMLLVIPGIVASYNYAMTGYILAEDPNLTAGEAIARSKQIMRGNRFRLFCLQFSFIGWDLLCLLSLGIGHLWLGPYKQAATAAFYREISVPTHRTHSGDPACWAEGDW